MPKAAKAKKPRTVNFELISEANREGMVPYSILKDLRDKYHRHLKEARIALAWRKNFKTDRDGHIILGKCVKASELHRQLAPYDFVILLNEEVWKATQFTEEKKRALIDHELCHAAVATDRNGDPVRNDQGRIVYRMRKHDIEEFRDIVQRHGCYKQDLEAFAEAIMHRKDHPLFAGTPDGKSKSAGLN